MKGGKKFNKMMKKKKKTNSEVHHLLCFSHGSISFFSPSRSPFRRRNKFPFVFLFVSFLGRVCVCVYIGLGRRRRRNHDRNHFQKGRDIPAYTTYTIYHPSPHPNYLQSKPLKKGIKLPFNYTHFWWGNSQSSLDYLGGSRFTQSAQSFRPSEIRSFFFLFLSSFFHCVSEEIFFFCDFSWFNITTRHTCR